MKTKSEDAVPTLNLAACPPLPWNVAERLRGRVIDPAWLAAGLHPDIDAARERQHELLRLAASAVDELQALRNRWAKQDREHAEQLREAVRQGKPEPVDKRTSPGKRLAEEGRLAEKARAAAEVLAEHVEHSVEVLRKAEDRIQADLRGQAGEASEQRRQAEDLLASARRKEWKLARLARWTMQTADDGGGFGQQPAPTGDEDPPHTFQGLKDSDLERHWARHREAEELPPSWHELSHGAAEPVEELSGDPTGVMQPLDEDVAA